MKNLIFYIFLLFQSFSFSQERVNFVFDRVIIYDIVYTDLVSYKMEYQLDLKTRELTLLSNPDSVIKTLEFNLLDSVFRNLTTPKNFKKDVLVLYGTSSEWYQNNIDSMWSSIKEKRKDCFPKEDHDSLIIDLLKDTNIVRSYALPIGDLYGHHSYLKVQLDFINGDDTLSLATMGRKAFMLPWEYKGYNLINSRLSKVISNVLPDLKYSNKKRLSGAMFFEELILSIYNQKIERKIEEIETRKKFKSTFKKLERDFKVKSVDHCDMTSIEWGGEWGAMCLELSLNDSEYENIMWYLILGTRMGVFSTSSFLRNREKIYSRLESNPVFQYCKNKKGALGEIHWVNSKSLSNQAKREFFSDLKASGQSRSTIKSSFAGAIFFELTDVGGEYSRWIFLKDGTIILWQLKSLSLMNFPEDYFKETGYICKVIELKEF